MRSRGFACLLGLVGLLRQRAVDPGAFGDFSGGIPDHARALAAAIADGAENDDEERGRQEQRERDVAKDSPASGAVDPMLSEFCRYSISFMAK